jgi:hypothetical protein
MSERNGRTPQDELAAGGRLAAETFGNEILTAALEAFRVDRNRQVEQMMRRAGTNAGLYRSLVIRDAHSIIDKLEKRQSKGRKRARRRARMAEQSA